MIKMTASFLQTRRGAQLAHMAARLIWGIVRNYNALGLKIFEPFGKRIDARRCCDVRVDDEMAETPRQRS